LIASTFELTKQRDVGKGTMAAESSARGTAATDGIEAVDLVREFK
jgi:hypothetical protein